MATSVPERHCPQPVFGVKGNLAFVFVFKSLLAGFLLLSIAASAQTRLDSLNSTLPGAISDSARAVINYALGYEYYLAGAHATSISHYKEALAYYESQHDELNQAFALTGVAETYRNEDIPDLAIEHFLNAARLFEIESRWEEVARIYNSLTDLFLRQGDLGSALVYTDKCREILKQQPDNRALAQLYNNVGRIYNDYKRYDSAIYYYDQAANIFNSLKLNHDRGRALHNMANSLREQGNLREALQLCTKVLEIREINENVKSRVFSLLLKSNIYADMHNAEEAIKYAQEGLRLAQTHGFRDRERVALLYLSDAYALIPDYQQAFHYHKKYAELMDIVYDSTKYTQVARMKTVYETEKNEQTIALQKANLEASVATIELQQVRSNLLLIAASFVLLLGVILFVGYVNKTKRNRILIQQKNEIERQNSEREILLKEIHHRVKNNLQVISSLLSMQSRKMQEGEAKIAVKEGQSRIKSMSLIHQKLYSEGNLSKINMKAYIEELSDFLFKSYKPGDDIHREIKSEDVFIDVDMAVPLGLIINELISNALKYAFYPSTEGVVKISLSKDDDDFLLEVSDSGKGLPADFENSHSMGMNLVNILVQQLDGSIDINSMDGTSFKIRFKDQRAA